MKIAALITLLIGLVFLPVGYAITYYIGKPMLDNAVASEAWPTAPGKILSSEVVRSQGDNGPMYQPGIVYRYSVNDQNYEGDTYAFNGNVKTSDSGWVREAVARYPAGADVQVHYDPDEPTSSVLEPGATTATYVIYGLGLGVLVIGGLLLLFPILWLLIAAFILFGAASGLIGRSPEDDPFTSSPLDDPRGRPEPHDDGISVQ